VSHREQVAKLGFAETPDNIWWSYDENEFSFRQNDSQIYFERPVFGVRGRKSLREECLRAARLISERHKRPVILYSGGIDSEVVLLSFYLQKLPFEVVIVDFDGKNRLDTDRARKFCESHGIAYRLISRDVLKFWENDMHEMAKLIHCTSPQVMALNWIVTQLDGYVICGDGDSQLMRSRRRFFDTKSELWAMPRWMLQNNKEGCPRFFQYTAELEASVYFEPLVEQFVADACYFFEFRKFMYLKPFIFHQYFGCGLREKLNGFEGIPLGEDYRRKLENMLPVMNDLSCEYGVLRSSAVQVAPLRKWVRLEESPLPEDERRGLCQIGNKDHLLWLE
jgi:hypothetical protein